MTAQKKLIQAASVACVILLKMLEERTLAEQKKKQQEQIEADYRQIMTKLSASKQPLPSGEIVVPIAVPKVFQIEQTLAKPPATEPTALAVFGFGVVVLFAIVLKNLFFKK